VQRESSAWLPRSGSPLDAERDSAQALARDLKVEATFVPIDAFEGLIPALLDGQGDLVAANLTVTRERSSLVTFSIPTELVRDQVVARANDTAISGPEDLDGRTLHVQRSSSFWETAQALRAVNPALRVVAADETFDVDALLDAVASGAFDLTVMDSNVMDAARLWRPDLRVAFELPQDRMIAWAMRTGATALRRAVDGFLSASGRSSASADRELRTDDLPGIRERGVLRVITRNNGPEVGEHRKLQRPDTVEPPAQHRLADPPQIVDGTARKHLLAPDLPVRGRCFTASSPACQMKLCAP
jgi:membrane-bound lytic murein transglycosylase F